MAVSSSYPNRTSPGGSTCQRSSPRTGDVLVHSRNLVYGSFANISPDPRVTVYFGYHARATVAGIYEEAHIEKRRQAIALAVRMRQRSVWMMWTGSWAWI